MDINIVFGYNSLHSSTNVFHKILERVKKKRKKQTICEAPLEDKKV